MSRVFLMVLDSVGIGEMPDAHLFGDEGSNTVKACMSSPYFDVPNLQKMGLFNIDGVDFGTKTDSPIASFARMKEASKGKDTTTGHWEMAGIISTEAMPTFPNGFPRELLDEFEKQTGRKVICNKPYSGTEVIKDYGREHIETGALIVYTSADPVFQIAAHEDIVPVEQLYEYCKIARKLCVGDYLLGRVIARPFIGTYPDFQRTSNRHDYSLTPKKTTMLDQLLDNGKDVISIGKISDIFNGKGISFAVRTKNNDEGIERTIEYINKDFDGLCFINLVDFDMLYGHRNDVDGYAKALTNLDKKLPEIISNLRDDDIFIITADHGCDPITPSTDHSREYVPMLAYGKQIKAGVDLGTRNTFADIGATILDYFNIDSKIEGDSFLHKIKGE